VGGGGGSMHEASFRGVSTVSGRMDDCVFLRHV
jgi:hypothetical protein